MGILRTKTIEPATGSTLTLGASGDTITVSSDSIKTNTFKDAGGNTLFTSDGAGTLSSVNSGIAGNSGPVLISTHTASGASSVAITSGIDSTYDEYMFVITDQNPVSHAYVFGFQVSIDGGSNYNVTCTSTFFSARQKEDGSGASLLYRTAGDQAQGTGYQELASNVHNDADAGCAGILHLFNPTSTTYTKNFYSRFLSYQNDNPGTHDGGPQDCFGAGYFNTTSAVTAIRFQMNNGNFDGVIQMYGIK